MRHRDREESDHSGMTLCGYNATALPHSETHATLVDGRRSCVPELDSCEEEIRDAVAVRGGRPHRWHTGRGT